LAGHPSHRRWSNLNKINQNNGLNCFVGADAQDGLAGTGVAETKA
jgi:hypothetical protein